ncbi:hypothetical protein GCM10022243_36900 [Saccharothrix violaceirubra]|uniref:Putative cofactor-binding repeat protein n=1 Tax=Saccharothrix violaceirubra TaxID=413306 RepID=A0A7W7WWI8_9PSEU|nr:right-handed parallel beta-helix repeat-containing protein [Saccharothrix violaceirubra]MBB4966395.1 putative cofactor-binding repeat protein [Saccharothrix violaceirubra]
MTDFHVSPTGDDANPGDAGRPFATLHRAVEAAGTITGQVVVHLVPGTHFLAEPLVFGENSGPIRIEGRDAVLSGGRVVDAWRERDGVWSADVGGLDTRHLAADGRRVERAAIPGIPGTASANDTGYVTDAVLDWRPGVEFVFRGVYPWTEARCPVAEVVRDGDTTRITMARPAFDRAKELYNATWYGNTLSGPGLPTGVENDPSFLTPDTFALDRSRPGHHVLHYFPLPGETPHVVAAALETLVHAVGARDLSFHGVTFADSTWLYPVGDNGFLHYHGNGHYVDGPIETVVLAEDEAWLTVPGRSRQIPAAVLVEDGTGVVFEDCRFTRLGATALGATGGTGLEVRRCRFDALAASAVALTGTRDAVVTDNVVRGTGLDHSGSPGVALLDTTDCTIAHNEITDVPHCGIVVGPGRGTRVLRNHVADSMGVLADGGGIYLSGPQGDSHDDGAVIQGNVIENTRTPYNFALYTDYGAAWVTVADNVVFRADNSATLTPSPPLREVVYRDNFWHKEPSGAVPEGVTYTGNVVLSDEAELLAATVDLRTRAGVR